jgi:hypothetical protein
MELLVTVAVVLLVVAAGASFMSHSSPDQQAAGERVLTDLRRVVTTRQAQARQLNTASRVGGTSLEAGVNNFDIKVDFAQLATTRTLALDGVDADGNGLDDNTGQQLARFIGANFVPAYASDPMRLPSGWSFAFTPEEMRGIPMIAGGTGQRGRPAQCVVFTPDGSTLPYGRNSAQPANCGSGGDTAVVSGTSRSNYLSPSTSPFLAVYVVLAPGGSAQAESAVALAVYPSGYTEGFRWDGSKWVGYNGRVIAP